MLSIREAPKKISQSMGFPIIIRNTNAPSEMILIAIAIYLFIVISLSFDLYKDSIYTIFRVLHW
jgi:hypothetical protein